MSSQGVVTCNAPELRSPTTFCTDVDVVVSTTGSEPMKHELRLAGVQRHAERQVNKRQPSVCRLLGAAAPDADAVNRCRGSPRLGLASLHPRLPEQWLQAAPASGRQPLRCAAGGSAARRRGGGLPLGLS